MPSCCSNNRREKGARNQETRMTVERDWCVKIQQMIVRRFRYAPKFGRKKKKKNMKKKKTKAGEGEFKL
jgi:hypothetical protein